MTPDAARKMWTDLRERGWSRVTEAGIVKRGMSHRALRRIAYGRMRMTIRLTVVGFAALMLVPTLADAQGLTWHYEPDSLVGTPDVTFAPQQHLAQQYDPPSLPPEIMVPERRPVGRQRAAPPITVVPLDPLPPEPTSTAPAPAPTVPVESNPLIEWCRQEANAKVPMCRNVGSPRVQR